MVSPGDFPELHAIVWRERNCFMEPCRLGGDFRTRSLKPQESERAVNFILGKWNQREVCKRQIPPWEKSWRKKVMELEDDAYSLKRTSTLLSQCRLLQTAFQVCGLESRRSFGLFLTISFRMVSAVD